MIIFHAGFYDRQLHLWGEAPPQSNATYTRKAKAASAKPLAYDAGSEALITGLLEIVPDLEMMRGTQGRRPFGSRGRMEGLQRPAR